MKKITIILGVLGILCIASPVFASDVGTTKQLPMSYLRQKIQDLIDGQEVFFPPLKTIFVVCHQRYVDAPAQEDLIIEETQYPLSPKYFQYFKSYKTYEVQLPGEKIMRTLAVCAKK